MLNLLSAALFFLFFFFTSEPILSLSAAWAVRERRAGQTVCDCCACCAVRRLQADLRVTAPLLSLRCLCFRFRLPLFCPSSVMFRNQYDTDITTFSPAGRLHQVTAGTHAHTWRRSDTGESRRRSEPRRCATTRGRSRGRRAAAPRADGCAAGADVHCSAVQRWEGAILWPRSIQAAVTSRPRFADRTPTTPAPAARCSAAAAVRRRPCSSFSPSHRLSMRSRP